MLRDNDYNVYNIRIHRMFKFLNCVQRVTKFKSLWNLYYNNKNKKYTTHSKLITISKMYNY